VLENPGLYEDLTAAENLEFYDRIYNSYDGREKRLTELLDLVRLSNARDQKIKTFSYGMKQRLAMARALIGDPSLLILDEPSKGLDVEGRVLMRELLLDLKKEGKTIFLSSHDLEEMQKIASHIGILSKGKILLFDPYTDLASHTPRIELEIQGKPDSLQNFDSYEWIKSWDFKGNTVVITLESYECKGRLLRLLADLDINILDLRTAKRSLEDLYLDIVRDEEANEDEY
jgi:ABC-2 type transport system ATP-binding protein